MYNPLKYFSGEMMKNIGERAKEVMTYLYPPVTVYEENGEIVIEADMPGFEKKDIKVQLGRDSISINATRKTETKGMVFMDQRPDSVMKNIRLPAEVDHESNFTAKYLNGVLTIRIPAKGIKSIKVE